MRIGFLGDTNFSGAFADARPNQPCWQAVRETLADNHYNVVNLEGPLTDHEYRKKPGESLRSKPSTIAVLKLIGTNILNLANNHIMDCGVAGLEDTLAMAAQNDWQTFGAGHNLSQASREVLLAQGDIRVAMIGLCHKEGPIAGEGAPGVFCHRTDGPLQRRLRQLKESHNWVVLNYHGGEEFTFLPMPSRMRLFRRYLNWGADIVVAHHPHVVQGFEVSETHAIFYSLGNFLFDCRYHAQHEGTDESVIVSVDFQRDSFAVHPSFTRLDRNGGTVNVVSENSRFQPIPTAAYHKKWQAECCRMFFKTPTRPSSPPIQDRSKKGVGRCTRVGKLAREACRLRNYLGLAKILRAPNSRPVFIAAVLGMIRKLIGQE